MLQADAELFAAANAGVKRGLADNYDDVEGYYNFQVCFLVLVQVQG